MDRNKKQQLSNNIRTLKKCINMIRFQKNNHVAGWLTSILHRMGVVQMDKKPFDFKDLMAFGMFILALLTFVFTFIR